MLTDLKKLTPDIYHTHCQWMEKVLILAKAAGERGEIPIAAIIVDQNNQLIAQATNEKEEKQDPTAHAELLAIRLASQSLQTWHLEKCTLYVNLEPCPMCAGAIIHSRLGTVVYGASDPKTGAIRTVINLPDNACSNHRPLVLGGIEERNCCQLLQNWFKQRRHT